MHQSLNPLDRCPVCRYSLEGLPSAHRCPECGFEYDADTRVWRPRNFWVFGGVLLMIAGTQIPQALGRLLKRNPAQASFWMNAALAMLFVGFIIALLFRYRSRPFVAVGPAGVTFRIDKSFAETILWDEIQRIDLGDNSKKFRHVHLITSTGGKVNLTRIINAKDDAIELKRCIEARLTASKQA